MSKLDFILKQYAAFETKIQRYTADFFRPYCSVCAAPCCHVDYCRETLESLFLELLRRKYQARAKFSGEHGWLSESGCILSVGRPPVCYEFLCNHMKRNQPTPIHQYVINVLSKLVSNVGKRAYRDRHIVEILNLKELNRVNLSNFENRLKESLDAFDAIQSFYENNFLSIQHMQSLNQIQKIPGEIEKLEQSINH